MPYAVTCKSCGARFSVADDLFRKKLQGKVVTLRCRQCGSAIRINASRPPAPPSSSERPRRLPDPPAPSRVSPPEADLDDEETFLALSPGLLTSVPPSPRKISESVVSRPASPTAEAAVSDAARPDPPPGVVSEPPSALSEPPASSVNAPKLSESLPAQGPEASRTTDDVDFLLGLSRSPGTNAARPAPPPPPRSELRRPVQLAARSEPPAAPTLARADTALAAGKVASNERATESGVLKYVLLGAALFGAGYFVMARGERGQQNAGQPTPAVFSAEAPEAATPTDPASDAPADDNSENSGGQDSRSHGTGPIKPAGKTHGAESSAATDQANLENTEGTVNEPGTPASSADPAPGAFDREAAASALTSAALEATACRKPGEPSGMASVVVTFAPSGRVTSATLNGPPFAGTATGGCIAATLRRARVPAFDGNRVTVAKTVVIQ